MEWSPESAVIAYLDTVKLCKLHHERLYGTACLPTESELQSMEFISALAAGMNAQLIVEICSGATPISIALAAAARQTGGRLVCILPDPKRCSDSMAAMRDLGLGRSVEFVVGDAHKLLPHYNNVDFALMDFKEVRDESGVFELLKLNPRCAVVVANNVLGRKATAAYASGLKRRAGAKSVTLPIGNGIEVTRITALGVEEAPAVGIEVAKNAHQKNLVSKTKPRWIVKIDKRTGEEHFFGVSQHLPDTPPISRVSDDSFYADGTLKTGGPVSPIEGIQCSLGVG